MSKMKINEYHKHLNLISLIIPTDVLVASAFFLYYLLSGRRLSPLC
jgi:hypothetical protein